MMNIDSIKYVYLIGIGGIGMSGLARYFKNQGYFVQGYDRAETELTKQLIKEGISVVYADDSSLIPEEVKEVSLETLIIYTPAIPAT